MIKQESDEITDEYNFDFSSNHMFLHLRSLSWGIGRSYYII